MFPPSKIRSVLTAYSFEDQMWWHLDLARFFLREKHSLKLTKWMVGGWNTSFLLGPGQLFGAIAVRFREGNFTPGARINIDVAISKIIPRTGETNKIFHQKYNKWNHPVMTNLLISPFGESGLISQTHKNWLKKPSKVPPGIHGPMEVVIRVDLRSAWH